MSLVAVGGWLLAVDEPEPSPEQISNLESQVADLRGAVEGSDLTEPFKGNALKALGEASQWLEKAEGFRREAVALENEVSNAPAELERLEAELAKPPETGGADQPFPEDVDSLRGQLEAQRAALATTSTQLEESQRQLEELRAQPVTVATRLPQAQAELAQKRAVLEGLGEPAEDSLSAQADRILVEAEIEALEAEVGLLEGQQLGHTTRERIAEIESKLLSRRTESLKEEVAQLEVELEQRLQGEVEELRKEVRGLVGGTDDEEVKALAVGLENLVAQLESTTADIKRVADRLEATRGRLDDLKKESQRLRRQVELGGKDGAFSQVLVDRQRRLEDQRSLTFEIRKIDEELSAAQLESFRLEDELEEVDRQRERWEDSPEATRVLEIRETLLEGSLGSQRILIQDLAKLSSDMRAYRDLAEEFSNFLSEQLFLSRSSPPIGANFFRQLPSAAGWALAPERVGQLGRSLLSVSTRHPFALSVFGLGIGVLVLLRPRLRASIDRSSKRIRRISTDRLGHTLRALFNVILLALPIPLAMGFLAWGLSSQPWADPWIRGFTAWLGWASWALMWILGLRELAKEDGVGQVHFKWKSAPSARLRSSLRLIGLVYLPCLLLTGLTVFESNPGFFDSLGRLGFIAAQFAMAWAFWKMFHPSEGVFADIIRDRPDRLLSKWRYLWIGVAAGVPVMLALMAALGYGITAMLLTEIFHSWMRWVAVGVVIYGLLLRWLMIRARRLRLQEAIAARKARRESLEEGEDPDEENTGETVVVEDAQVELDLEEVAQQMRRLLRSLVGVGVLMAMFYVAASMLPIGQAVDAEFKRFSWQGLLRASLIGAVSLTLIRNLPGLVDLLGMRASGASPGVRYAVTTLCQYGVGAIAILLATQALAVDWSKFGWIAAALSVGLGFGLQEIVANFVCGIIVLFERPVRVGDVVTVGNVTGTVSRIRMRATTITNWERQEFVVPNKDFITGSLINWTLSSPLNRVTLNVGVAYGTDTVEARRILTEIAEAHPQVLEDPAPLINFETFGDSTLDMSVRCYLPNMDNRLRTITELNEEIDRRFKEAGIEIAFPQRDLHIRSMPAGSSPAAGPNSP